MNAAQKAKIEANRKLALERLKQRGLLNKLQVKSIESRNAPPTKPLPTTNKVTKPGSYITESNANAPVLEQGQRGDVPPTSEKKKQYIRPSVRAQDYIDYDFSTMQDLHGGYINPHDRGNYNSSYGDESSYDNTRNLKTLEDWKQEQKARRNLYENAPPPEHISLAIKCQECHINIEMDPILDDVFKLHVCKQCAKAYPQKYSLLTKTECKEDYFLTEDELADLDLFHRLEKPNPHSGTFARMQLFVRCEIETFAFKKWGGEDGLDKEWERRETQKTKRKEQLYKKEINTMRLKTRAQEFTKRLREKKYGKLHKHQYGEPIGTHKDEDGNVMVKRRCIECGLEVDEIDI
ncbi:DNA repair protein Rad14p [Monosporozyma servazzii]